MKAYEKIGWLDHVQDIETGEVIQEGTPVSQVNMNQSFSMRLRLPTRRKRLRC